MMLTDDVKCVCHGARVLEANLVGKDRYGDSGRTKLVYLLRR